jgi:CRISPR-associated endonuclease/helicase Cas3
MAGIDSIVQAAGRCNREGKIEEGGRLFVFTPEDDKSLGPFKQNAQIAELVLDRCGGRILDSDTIREYFKELYWLKDSSGGLDAERILDDFAAGAVNGDFPFKSAASRYRLIPDAQIPVFVPYDDKAKRLCDKLRYHPYPGALLRSLQPYAVQVFPRSLAALLEAGFAEMAQDQYCILSELGMKQAYDDDFGLNPDLGEFIESEHLVL